MDGTAKGKEMGERRNVPLLINSVTHDLAPENDSVSIHFFFGNSHRYD